MVYKVYGIKNFSGTQIVLLALEELRLQGKLDQEYEVVYVDMTKGEHKSEKYRREMQPFAQTPVLVSGLSL